MTQLKLLDTINTEGHDDPQKFISELAVLLEKNTDLTVIKNYPEGIYYLGQFVEDNEL